MEHILNIEPNNQIDKRGIHLMYREDAKGNMPLDVPQMPMQGAPVYGPVPMPGPCPGPMPPMPGPCPGPMPPTPGPCPGPMPPMPGPCPPEHMRMFMQAYHHVSMAYYIMTQMMQMMRR